MRIIAGKHRGRTILGPRDEETTRPIADRVKEALFSRLYSLGMLDGPDEDSEPWIAADVFSGTGSMGLECLSRGAGHVLFVDRDRDAVRRLEDNLETLGEKGRATVVHGSALVPTWAARLSGPLRLAFLDPPYAMVDDPDDRPQLEKLVASLLPRLEEGGVLVLRTQRDSLPLDAPGYDGPASFRYGGMTLHFYQRPLPEGEDEEEGDETGLQDAEDD